MTLFLPPSMLATYFPSAHLNGIPPCPSVSFTRKWPLSQHAAWDATRQIKSLGRARQKAFPIFLSSFRA